MQHYPIDQAVREIWKIYPVRIQGRSRSACHDLPTLLVQRFITRSAASR